MLGNFTSLNLERRPIGGRAAFWLYRSMEEALAAEERLILLQAIDRGPRWYSLDDKRICGICEQVFSGRQIQFQDRGQAGCVIHCPTPDCPGDFADWMVWDQSRDGSPPASPAAHPTEGEFSFL